MTKYEDMEFKRWNREITTEELLMNKRAEELREKYLKLNGTYSCEYMHFIYEICTTESTSMEEKLFDLTVFCRYLQAKAKSEALSDILHIQNK